MGSLEDYLELEWIEGRAEEHGDAEDEFVILGDADDADGAARLVLEHARVAWWHWHLPAHWRWAPPWDPTMGSADLFVACTGCLNINLDSEPPAVPVHASASGHPPSCHSHVIARLPIGPMDHLLFRGYLLERHCVPLSAACPASTIQKYARPKGAPPAAI